MLEHQTLLYCESGWTFPTTQFWLYSYTVVLQHDSDCTASDVVLWPYYNRIPSVNTSLPVQQQVQLDCVGRVDKPARLIIRFGFPSDSDSLDELNQSTNS